MRVTKTIRDYITKEVAKRITPKYMAEEAEANRQNALIDELREACANAARKAYDACFEEMFSTVADFAYDNRSDISLDFNICRAVKITGEWQSSSVHYWRSRKQKEVEKLLVQSIWVTQSSTALQRSLKVKKQNWDCKRKGGRTHYRLFS